MDGRLQTNVGVIPPPALDWPDSAARLGLVVEMVKDISLQTDPQTMVAVFRKRAMALYGGDSSLSLSRRDLEWPFYRITRSTTWKEDINPWEEPHRLPLLKGGLLADLVHGDQPRMLPDVHVEPDDSAYEYLKDVRSLVALPIYEGGTIVNMVLRMSRRPAAWGHLRLADAVLEANLFGRATSHLLTAQRLQKANTELERDLKQIAEIQRSLLPARLPSIPGVDIAVSYKTAARAGGDYYDFFDLGDGRWGFLIADVSGHGTPAAVVMAMFRTMLHFECMACASPGQVLARCNAALSDRTELGQKSFVTAFYGVYDSGNGALQYACAGHHPPLLIGPGGHIRELDEAQSVPLAVQTGAEFPESTATLRAGDSLVLYTDGITEAVSPGGESYGCQRLVACVRDDVPNAQHIIDCVTYRLLGFTDGRPQQDDQTLVALRVRS